MKRLLQPDILSALLLWTICATPRNLSAQSAPAIEFDPSDPKVAKIILLAGVPSSKSGAHEYFAGCALLTDWLKQTPGVWPVLVRNSWPTNEQIFENTKAIVVFMDGGAKHPLVEPAHWSLLKKLVDRGTGLVVLHQAVDLPQSHAAQMKRWLGGVWLADIGCRGHWDMELKPAGEHPVLRGVKAFTAKGDGWLYNLHFADPPEFTPLLVGTVPDSSRTTADAKKHVGRDEVLAWAYERPTRGRSFAFTGCDLHKNWEIESQRRLVVNGILWTAGVKVPNGGARADFDPGDLQRNLERGSETPNTKNQTPTKLQPSDSKSQL